MSEDDDLEIEISEVRKIDSTFEVGEEYTQEIEVAKLGRRSILTLKQILATKIQEHFNAALYDQFRDKIGELIVGEVHHIRHKHVILLDDEDNEFILPKENQSDRKRHGTHQTKDNHPCAKLTSSKVLEIIYEFIDNNSIINTITEFIKQLLFNRSCLSATHHLLIYIILPLFTIGKFL
jgi:hypothetical protein